jgi:hypothetical protein
MSYGQMKHHKRAALVALMALPACSDLPDAGPISGPEAHLAFARGGGAAASGNGKIPFTSDRHEPGSLEIYSMN